MNAPPDGYTLLLVSAANAINASMFDKLNFNFIHDIGAVGGLIKVPSVILLHPSSQVRTVPEFIAYAKQSAGKLSMASGGTGTTTHLAGELLKIMAGILRGVAESLLHISERQIQFSHHVVRRSPVSRRGARQHRRNTIDYGFQRFILNLN